jgi:hypothetical protein
VDVRLAAQQQKGERQTRRAAAAGSGVRNLAKDVSAHHGHRIKQVAAELKRF